MAICYIFHSETGNTRSIIDHCTAVLNGDRIEVHDLAHYNWLTKFIVGGRRARKGLMDPIEPTTIDVSKYAVIVIGSPVWAQRPTPAINAAIPAMKGCEGKKVVIFVTCGGTSGESVGIMRKAVEAKGMLVKGTTVFTRRDLRDQAKLNSLIDLIKQATIP